MTGEVAPPWAVLPTEERYSIGWRMGHGEGVMHDFFRFAGSKGDWDEAAWLGYLRRHPVAPYTWADWIDAVIFGNEREEWDLGEPEVLERHHWLLEQGLIGSDVAYATWRAQQGGVLSLPWGEGPFCDNPLELARYNLREFAFQSRQVGDVCDALPDPPPSWQFGNLGLERLAQQLVSGQVLPPWRLGFSGEDFEDSFEDDMGYVDAFRLWILAAFDDLPHLNRYLDSVGGVPPEWERWVNDNRALPI